MRQHNKLGIVLSIFATLLIVGCAPATPAVEAIATPGASVSEATGDAPAAEATGPAIWFDELLTGQPPDTALAIPATQYAVDLLSSAAGDAPAELTADTGPRIAFVSVSDGQSRARVAWGSAESLDEAVRQAVDALPADDAAIQWVRVDLVQQVITLPGVDTSQAQPDAFPRSLYGLAFDRASALAFLPDETVARTLIDSDALLRMNNIAGYAPEDAFDTVSTLAAAGEAGTLETFRFSTAAAFSNGVTVEPLLGGHRIVALPLSADELLTAATAGGEYLVAATGEDGRFVYRYLPKADEVPDNYNILRHAGTIYAMLELYEVTGDASLLDAAERAIGYLMSVTEHCVLNGEDALCVIENDEIKLGGAGLAIVALAQYTEVTGDEQYIDTMEGLATWIAAAQAENGEFIAHKVTLPGNDVTSFRSDYYPGEALLALCRLYAIDGRSTWLNVAEAGASWLINTRDAGLETAELNHDHWLLYALNDLYTYRPDEQYLTHAMRIAEAISGSQMRDPLYPEWRGGYYTPPRSTPTATRSEGLYAATQLAEANGLPDEVARFREALEEGARFQLQTQFTPASALYVDDPQRVLGGFHYSLDNYEIRIDYVQHNLSSLLGLYHLMTVDELEPVEG